MSGKCGFTASSSWLFGSSSVAQGASFDFFLFAMRSRLSSYVLHQRRLPRWRTSVFIFSFLKIGDTYEHLLSIR
jgi:hypothetical protein